MEGASPTTTNTSTGNHRGRRPKDWTEERTRKLIRLYVYTTLPVGKITNALTDLAWEPGKEVANKWLHTLLGHDPMPKTPGKQDKRMAGLRACRRGSKDKRELAAALLADADLRSTHEPLSNLPAPDWRRRASHDFY
ncbi:hypothetical protein DL766_001421 [Monosporascus sp. MC13-8B]|uniref:Uncharacterized protein n=1 Tax=Monosporascus cannonballus TaxID=155416 RepID=A0ABY0H3D6_9PEZI|nr:hypothetical protein DL762_005976 [Monosporascus cannonballus]RYP37680.1 hypothetical protein DL766_001421 [Monosporascus sp. MC13-8B]